MNFLLCRNRITIGISMLTSSVSGNAPSGTKSPGIKLARVSNVKIPVEI
ncbi:hypothetical protein ACIXNV_08710 [Bacteroides fragilis]